MEITIENFGPISKFSVDLNKHLNLFVGKNNTGKSYAFSVIYFIVKSLSDSCQQEPDCCTLEPFLSILSASLKRRYSSLENLRNSFSKKSPVITIVNEDFSVKILVAEPDISISEVKFQGQVLNLVTAPIDIMDKLLRSFRQVDGNVLYLPAGPSCFWDESSTLITAPSEKKEVLAIADDIEKNILDGQVNFDIHTRELTFTPKRTKLKLDLSVASSMVSKVAPIVVYLRHVCRAATESTSLIIMEEPEAQLHPEVQVKLTQIFSKLIKVNIKLLMTTHSSYIFNKINNLIMSKDIDVDTINMEVFKETKKGSRLKSLDLNEFGAEDDNFAETIGGLFDEKMDIVDAMNADENDNAKWREDC